MKSFIDTGAGVIDADYRGQVKVLLFNHAEVDFEGRFEFDLVPWILEKIHDRALTECMSVVKEGDRIAQLVLERVSCLEETTARRRKGR